MSSLPAPPCLEPPTGEPGSSRLHLEGLKRADKTEWIKAAAKCQLPLAEWVERELNRSAKAALDAEKTKSTP